MTTTLTVPRKHLIINKDDAVTIPGLMALIKGFAPDLPDTFINALTIIIGSGKPNITGANMGSNLETVATRIHQLYYDPGIIDISKGQTADLSFILYYVPEQNILVWYLAALSDIQSLPDGTFASQTVGHDS